jgi:hypothetical protein
MKGGLGPSFERGREITIRSRDRDNGELGRK